MSMTDLARLLTDITALAHRAGDAIMEIYATDFEHETKADESPVTAADLAAEAIIERGLRELAPDIPLVAEEAASQGRLPDISGGRFWLVDPMDGTREFLNRNGEFTVNIALVENGRPVIGVVYAPALKLTFSGQSALGATRTNGDGTATTIRVRPVPADGVAIVASRRHGDPEAIGRLLRGHTVAERKTAGKHGAYRKPRPSSVAAGPGGWVPASAIACGRPPRRRPCRGSRRRKSPRRTSLRWRSILRDGASPTRRRCAGWMRRRKRNSRRPGPC